VTVLLHGLRILVVDDDEDARDLLETILIEAGGQVVTAASTAEAFDALPVFQPDVVISDIGMPEEDGYSFIRNLRQVDPVDGGAIPAVALTSYTRAEDRKKAMAAGFTTHIGKPVHPAELLAAVMQVVAQKVSPPHRR